MDGKSITCLLARCAEFSFQAYLIQHLVYATGTLLALFEKTGRPCCARRGGRRRSGARCKPSFQNPDEDEFPIEVRNVFGVIVLSGEDGIVWMPFGRGK